VPLVVGDAGDALVMCEGGIARGVFAQAIRPPTVPAGSSRLRLTVMASHTKRELREAAAALADAARAAGVDPRSTGLPRAQEAAAIEPAAEPVLVAEPEVASAGPFDGEAPLDGAVPLEGAGPFDGEADGIARAA
jgi:glycine C-acetyltransferase/8-amino-7-oxononanoate synthase